LNQRKSANIVTTAAIDQLRTQANALSVELSDSQIDLIGKFLDELAAYNEHTNLVSKADADIVIRDHVLDALSLLYLVPDSDGKLSLVDIGSGAGFPAMILAIAVPNLSVVMIDSIGKKTKFLTEAAAALGLSDRVTIETGRAEDFAHEKRYRDKFDLATARAVGKLDLVVELTLPFLRVGGTLLAQKSNAQLSEELEPGRKAASLLGGKIGCIEKLNASVLGRELVVVCVEKDKATPRHFPRPTPQLKRPLGQ
jgi:16S rRNA (guanine527-N7)-methyltransferase